MTTAATTLPILRTATAQYSSTHQWCNERSVSSHFSLYLISSVCYRWFIGSRRSSFFFLLTDLSWHEKHQESLSLSLSQMLLFRPVRCKLFFLHSVCVVVVVVFFSVALHLIHNSCICSRALKCLSCCKSLCTFIPIKRSENSFIWPNHLLVSVL